MVGLAEAPSFQPSMYPKRSWVPILRGGKYPFLFSSPRSPTAQCEELKMYPGHPALED